MICRILRVRGLARISARGFISGVALGEDAATLSADPVS